MDANVNVRSTSNINAQKTIKYLPVMLTLSVSIPCIPANAARNQFDIGFNFGIRLLRYNFDIAIGVLRHVEAMLPIRRTKDD